ncbi:MAG: hypothetical protein PHT40_02915 [Patescibacteria group bacterium]|nr:hypothetical protein [Patescibacteria group bacterium]
MYAKKLFFVPFLATLIIGSCIFTAPLSGGKKTNFAKNREKELLKQTLFLVKNDSLDLKNNPIVERRNNFIIVNEVDLALRLKGIDGNGISSYVISEDSVWISFQRSFKLEAGDEATLNRIINLVAWSFELQAAEKKNAQNIKNILSLGPQNPFSLNTELVRINADTVICGKKIIRQKVRPRAFIDLVPYKKELEDNNKILEQVYRRMETIKREKTINSLSWGIKS